MTDGSEINENDVAVRLLQSNCGIDCSGGAPRAAFGAQEGKHTGLARATKITSASGTEAGQGFQQGVRARGLFQVLARTGPHGGPNVGGLGHFAVGEDGNLQSGGANEFDGADGALCILSRDIDDHDLSAGILELSKECAGGGGG